MDHRELVNRSERWLLTTRGCGFVFIELATSSVETPDAIGWRASLSHLIECKANRSDFLADKRKSFRRNPELGMGNYRYYACPPELIKVEDLPDRWGLLWVYPTRVKVVHRPFGFFSPKIAHNERKILCSALRRVHLRGDLHKIYQPFNPRRRIIKCRPR